MKKHMKAVLFGFILWLVPFLSGFPFVDSSGNFLIPETFFKTIMIVVSGLTGVILAVLYFRKEKKDYKKVGITIGLIWLVINWGIDLIFVQVGFFPMSMYQYFTDIGLRYLSIPIYTIGMGSILEMKLTQSKS